VLILLITQVFLEVIVLSPGRRIPRISSSSTLRDSSSNKRKGIVKESVVVEHTRQMAFL